MEFLTRLFPQVRQLQRDAIRIRSEREEWRQRYTSLQARAGLNGSAPALPGESDWRLRIALWSAEQACALPGDFVECCVRRDSFSTAVMESLDWARVAKTFYLLRENDAESSAEVSAFANVRIIRGAIPDALAQVTSQQIALLSIGSSGDPSDTSAAALFWPRLVRGAVVFLNTHRDPQSRAWDAFAADRKTPILWLPTGQGILIKQ